MLKIYEITVDSKELFSDIEQRLKQLYPELENEKMDVFSKDSEIINKKLTVLENNIGNDAVIMINNSDN